MPLVITVAGNDEIINAGVDSFAKYHGWTSKIPNPDYDASDVNSPVEIDNPQTTLEHANYALGMYFRNCVVAWNAQEASEQAASTASSQSNAALDLTSVTSQVVPE